MRCILYVSSNSCFHLPRHYGGVCCSPVPVTGGIWRQYGSCGLCINWHLTCHGSEGSPNISAPEYVTAELSMPFVLHLLSFSFFRVLFVSCCVYNFRAALVRISILISALNRSDAIVVACIKVPLNSSMRLYNTSLPLNSLRELTGWLNLNLVAPGVFLSIGSRQY